MRGILLGSTAVVIAACGGGTFNGTSNDQGTVETQLTEQLMQAGVQCAPHMPPEAVQACTGKGSGDACSVVHEDETFNGVCRAMGDGTLVCAPPAAPPPVQSAIDACAGKTGGDACQLGTAAAAIAGTCREFDSDVLACIPNHTMPPVPAPFPPPPPVQACVSKQPGDTCSFAISNMTFGGVCRQFGDGDGDADDVLACVPPGITLPPGPPADACTGKGVGDACSITVNGKTLNGVCHQFPNGASLLCLPPPPAPPQQTLDACIGHSLGDVCSVTFRAHTVTGACEPVPDGSALACAPICRAG